MCSDILRDLVYKARILGQVEGTIYCTHQQSFLLITMIIQIKEV